MAVSDNENCSNFVYGLRATKNIFSEKNLGNRSFKKSHSIRV